MTRTQRATLTVLIVAVTAFSLAQSLLIPELGPLARELDTDQSTITWLLTAYLISASVSTPIAGRLGDVWGKDRALVVSLGLLAAGSLMGALAPDVGWMIAARALQGAGGGVLPLSFGIIRDELPPDRVPQAIGITTSLLTVGIGGGIVLAGPLVSILGYSWLFWAPFVVLAGATLAAARVVPRSPTRTGERIRPLPAVLLAGWLVLLLVPVSRASVWGWTSPAVLAPLAGAVAVFALWARTELRSDVPLIDLRGLRHRSVWTAHAIAFLIGFGLYSSSTLVPQFLQTPVSAGYGFGVTTTESGLMLIPQTLFSFAAGISAARAAQRLGSRTVVISGALLAAAGTALLALAGGSLIGVYAGTSLIGFGIGLSMALLANLVVAAVPAEQTGVAAGTNANLRTIGGAIGSAVLTSIVTAQVTATGRPSADGYTAGFAIIAAMLVVAAAVGLLVPVGGRRPPADSSSTPHEHAAEPTPGIVRATGDLRVRLDALVTTCLTGIAVGLAGMLACKWLLVLATSVPADLASLENPDLVLGAIVPAVGNSVGYFLAYRRTSRRSLTMFLGPGVVLGGVGLAVSLSQLPASSSHISVAATVIVSLVAPVAIIALLLARGDRLRRSGQDVSTARAA